MKELFIALDYSTISKKVAETGFVLGNDQEAEITLRHIINNPDCYGTALIYPIMEDIPIWVC